jgi:hypothetical protein
MRLNDERRLLLENRRLSRRVVTLFNELNEDESLQEAFIESPIEVIGQEVLRKTYNPEQASAVNKFIFSVLANERLQQWSAEYDRENAGRDLTAEQRLQYLAKAFTEFGDPSLMEGLLEMASTGVDIPGLTRASVAVKAESVAIGNWFVYKVSGRDFGDDNRVLPAAQVQKIAEQLVNRAQQLKQEGLI